MRIEDQPTVIFDNEQPENQHILVRSEHTSYYQGNGAADIPNEEPVLTATMISDVAMQIMPIFAASGTTPGPVNHAETQQIIQVIESSQLPEYYKTNTITFFNIMDTSTTLQTEYEQSSNKNEVLGRILDKSIEIAKAAIDVMAPEIDEDITYSLSYKLTNEPANNEL
jgi:hypothetical protein